MEGPDSLDKWLANGVLISDGAWGTQLQARGLPAGIIPDTWNLTHPEQVEAVARAYVEAGSQVILTNSFRANAIAMHASSAADLDAINRAAVTISKKAAGARALVFASIGPAGKMLLSGEVSAEELTAAFSAQAQSLARCRRGRAADRDDERSGRSASGGGRRRKLTGLPVIASFAFDSGKNKDRTMMGATPEVVAAAMAEAGADGVGANCGVGVEFAVPICQRLHAACALSYLDQAQRGIAGDGGGGDSLRDNG
jgi:5-methyltetrahydrofolate--homocysteine methyltransferase